MPSSATPRTIYAIPNSHIRGVQRSAPEIAGDNNAAGYTGATSSSPGATDSLQAAEEPERMILVMGNTGAGKSYFINRIAGKHEAKEGHKLRSETKHCQAVTVSVGANTVTVVDTPGFDDDARNDGKTLNIITRFVIAQYRLGIRLKGVIFLHRITDNRIGGSSRRYLEIFRAMWGDNAFGNIALVSSMWSKINVGEGLRRDVELREDLWKEMIAKGSNTFQYNGTPEMARTIVGQTLVKPDVVLQIQRELVDRGTMLSDTSAGRIVREDLQHQLEERRGRILSLRERFNLAQTTKNASEQEVLRTELTEQREQQLRQINDCDALREDIVKDTDQEIASIDAEEESAPKQKKKRTRVQKFVKVLQPVVALTLSVLGFLVQLGVISL